MPVFPQIFKNVCAPKLLTLEILQIPSKDSAIYKKFINNFNFIVLGYALWD